MTPVTKIKPSLDVAASLRAIADDIDKGEITGDSVTVIADLNLYHFGCVSDERAAADALFNCQYLIHRLMSVAASEVDAI